MFQVQFYIYFFKQALKGSGHASAGLTIAVLLHLSASCLTWWWTHVSC